MKQLYIFVVVVGIFLSGCANSQPETPSQTQDKSTANKVGNGIKKVGESIVDGLIYLGRGGVLDMMREAK